MIVRPSLFSFIILICYFKVETANPGPGTNNAAKDGRSLPCSKNLANSLWPYSAKLLRNLRKEVGSEENILFSPVSTYLALAALSMGAGERTRKDLIKILKLAEVGNDNELTGSNLHETLAHLEESMQHHTLKANAVFAKAELANGLFVHKEFPIKDSYSKLLKKFYNGNASNIDFTRSAEATDIINKWISEKTVGHISKFYDKPIDASTVATLVSTLYFNGKWKMPFSKTNTKQEKFNTGSSSIKVPMMYGKDQIQYESDPSLQIESICIPYAGGEYGMTFMLPYRSQTINNLTDHLDLLEPLKFSKAAKITYVDYKIPKMKFTSKRSLVSALEANSIFENPDLSELTAKKIKIPQMIHAAELEVDEDGSIASAITAIEGVPISLPVQPSVEPVKFHVDRPFLVGIIHRPTCSVLFMGKVHKPL